jgi:serine/threonine-protein kinase
LKFNPKLVPKEVEAAFGGKFISVQGISDGEGGQGMVFKATPVSTTSSVALKIYYPGSLSERTKREVEAMRRIRCDTLVKLYDAGHVVLRGQNQMYVATEYVDGELLSSVINRGALQRNKVAQIGHDIAMAIDAVWQERIVHRDIKPTNIMQTSNGKAVLIDLGVARHLSHTPLTTIGKTWGTEGYMSPEQAQALRQLSCKSDIFALGIVLQELILGRHPTDWNQLLLARGGIPTAKLMSGVNTDFVSLLDSMLLANPHQRPSPINVAERFKNHF